MTPRKDGNSIQGQEGGSSGRLFERKVIENTKLVSVSILESGTSIKYFIKCNFKSSPNKDTIKVKGLNFEDPLALPKLPVSKECWGCHTNCTELQRFVQAVVWGTGQRREPREFPLLSWSIAFLVPQSDVLAQSSHNKPLPAPSLHL